MKYILKLVISSPLSDLSAVASRSERNFQNDNTKVANKL